MIVFMFPLYGTIFQCEFCLVLPRDDVTDAGLALLSTETVAVCCLGLLLQETKRKTEHPSICAEAVSAFKTTAVCRYLMRAVFADQARPTPQQHHV